MYMHMSTYMFINMLTYVWFKGAHARDVSEHMYIHVDTHACKYTNTHTHIAKPIQTHMHNRTHTHMPKHVHAQQQTYVYASIHVKTSTHANTHQVSISFGTLGVSGRTQLMMTRLRITPQAKARPSHVTFTCASPLSNKNPPRADISPWLAISRDGATRVLPTPASPGPHRISSLAFSCNHGGSPPRR